ncbi:MAG: hypothetical protein IJ783_07595, partial [Kiritimatiellae bacterium]|nr:hypothetical protein [Kiritimatiellia bacterium]
ADHTISMDGAGRRKFLGSPAYAAPEQFDPAAGPDTPALDWYAFGAVVFRALTGRRPGSPRKASSFDPRHLSRAWDPLLDALLEPDPAKRLSDPAAVLRGLRRVERLPAPRRIARNLVAFWSLCLLAGLAAGLAIYGPRRLREKIGWEAESPPQSTVRRSNGSTVQRTIVDADSGPPTRPQPVPGILGLVQSPAFTNPVTDFSVPDTERGLWIPTRKWQIPAGTENFLPVGAATNRLRLVWCPVPEDSPEAPDPSLAPGFWILDRPVSQELAALVLNHLAESRSDPVARPEDPRRGEWPAAIGGEAIEPLLVSMTRFAGIPIDLLAFSVPTPGQLLVAENVLREHGGTLPPGDVWTSELLSLAAPPGSSFMNLQPVLRPYPKLSR